jgi:hypothetical protein
VGFDGGITQLLCAGDGQMSAVSEISDWILCLQSLVAISTPIAVADDRVMHDLLRTRSGDG